MGGLTSRELLAVLRGLKSTNFVGGDVVEVAPAYDHAEITGIAASHLIYEMVSLVSNKQLFSLITMVKFILMATWI